MIVNGLRFEVEFWKGTLEKIHVEPSFLMLEEYKSAGEVYSRNEMSDAFREQLTAIGEDIQGRMVSMIAERRKIDPEIVRETVDRGLLTAPEALDTRWVDRLGFVDELEETMAMLQMTRMMMRTGTMLKQMICHLFECHAMSKQAT